MRSNNFKDKTGMVVGRLTVIEIDEGKTKARGTKWKCQCECGNMAVVSGNSLISGHTRSCGCLQREAAAKSGSAGAIHNGSQTRLYRTWAHMKGRCYDKNDASYSAYGGRGITVCDEWRYSFGIFQDWAKSSGYEDHLTIERVDVNGNYEPSNCTWIPKSEQALNTRRSVFVEYLGEKLTVNSAARKAGLSFSCLRGRMLAGVPSDNLFDPPRKWPTRLTVDPSFFKRQKRPGVRIINNGSTAYLSFEEIRSVYVGRNARLEPIFHIHIGSEDKHPSMRYIRFDGHKVYITIERDSESVLDLDELTEIEITFRDFDFDGERSVNVTQESGSRYSFGAFLTIQ